MNREIKFRAWHNTEKVMLYPPLPTDSMTSIRLNSPNGPHWEYDGISYCAQMMWDGRMYIEGKYQDVTWMQYTGLKDSNGVEIFEGDIILDEWAQDDPFSNTPDVPRYEHKIFEVKYIEGCFNLKKDPIKHRCSFNFKRKVVGNIFENKDLLPIPVQIKETLNDEEFSTSEMIELLLNKV